MRTSPFALALLAAVIAAGPARGQDAALAPAMPAPSVPAPSVPGPLRGTPPPLPAATAAEQRRPDPAPVAPPRPEQPVAPVKVWAGTLAPPTPGGNARGKVAVDVAARELRLTDLVVDDAPGLEVILVAGDAPLTTEAVLAAKRVSLGRLRKPKGPQVYRVPAELDLTVYRAVIVWARRDKAPRALARLAPARG